MTPYLIFFMYDVTKSLKMRKWRHISLLVQFIKKCPVITFSSIKFSVERAIWQLSTVILKFFDKNFQWGGILENRGAVREISTDFQSENGFDLTPDRRIKFWAIDRTTDTIIFPHHVTPLPILRWFYPNRKSYTTFKEQYMNFANSSLMNYLCMCNRNNGGS